MTAVIVLAAATALAAYILVGYPLLLAIVPGRAAPPVHKDRSLRPTVSIILAVYNGEAYLRRKLESIFALNYPHDKLEILVVSDGSTDRTAAIAAEFANVILLNRPRGGKAAALNAALDRATGEILFFTDVRQTLDPASLDHLAANFADPTVGVAAGDVQWRTPLAGEPADLGLYWRYEAWARRQHSLRGSLFNASGCIYAMRRSLARPIPPETLSDDALLPLGAYFRGYRVVLDPAAIAYDEPALAGTEFRRRWRNLAGLWQIHVWRPKLFTSANRMRLHFLSHKFGRLVLPWMLLTMVAAGWALPSLGWRNWLRAVEVVFLAVALADGLIPAGWWLKRITSPTRTFLLMNAAALLAPAVFFVSPQKLWKPTRTSKSG
ncbi:MAG: glycosyltransferase family 2 protein [Bryobacteraceae bacterium]